MDVAEVEAQAAVVDVELAKARKELRGVSQGQVCQGGLIVLVPTDKPINEWQAIAERDLPSVEWIWH